MSATETPDPPPAAQLAVGETASAPPELPWSKRSYRRKYRKIMVNFEHRMQESNALFRDEQRIFDISQRLAEQTDQLLQLMVDLNSSPQVPKRLRYDIRPKHSPAATNIEHQEVHDERAGHLRLRKARYQLQTGEMTTMQYQDLKDELLKAPYFAPEESYADLTQFAAHPTAHSGDEKDLTNHSMVPYLSSKQEDQYQQSIDTYINEESGHPRAHATHSFGVSSSDKTAQREREMQLRNPVSVYNWLRKNKPGVFLQDNESAVDKPVRTTGSRISKRNANRDSIVKQEPELYDEDGIAMDAPSGRGKRKRENDSGYRPKGGNARPAKRKKEDNGSNHVRGGSREEDSGGTHSRRASKKLSIDAR